MTHVFAHTRRRARAVAARIAWTCLVLLAAPNDATAQSATRSLPNSYASGQTLVVTIEIVPPGGTAAVGLEDTPPTGWTVSDISSSGELDELSGKVKWGPFFAPSIPASVSYSVTPPPSASGGCFGGTILFDVTEVAITGDDCLVGPIPTASGWTLAIAAIAVLIAGSVVTQVRPARR